MRKLFTLLLILFCFKALAQSDTSWLHQKDKAIKHLNKDGYIGLELSENSFEINHRFAAQAFPAFGFAISAYRVTLDLSVGPLNNVNSLLYSFNNAPTIAKAQYDYSFFYMIVDLGYLVKTVSIGNSVVSLNAGARLELFQVGDPSIAEITSLASNGNSPISITQMGNNTNLSGYLELLHPFWVANQSFLISLKGGDPVHIYYSKNKYFSENTYNPQSRVLFSIGLKYNASPKFRANPLKSKSL